MKQTLFLYMLVQTLVFTYSVYASPDDKYIKEYCDVAAIYPNQNWKTSDENRPVFDKTHPSYDKENNIWVCVVKVYHKPRKWYYRYVVIKGFPFERADEEAQSQALKEAQLAHIFSTQDIGLVFYTELAGYFDWTKVTYGMYLAVIKHEWPEKGTILLGSRYLKYLKGQQVVVGSLLREQVARVKPRAI